VNILDLIFIAKHWRETGTPCWIPIVVNCEGVISILDMILVGQHWTGYKNKWGMKAPMEK
jgi:hypothetical protein